MGACENVPDGGCGTCGDSVAQVGQRCRWSADGGTPRSIACAEGHQCDDSDTCVPYRAAGGSCGTGVGACEPACGLSCKETDAGSACLTTAHVNAGAPCSYFAEPTIYCGAGLACVLRGTDAGYPDFQAPGTCRAQAIAGQQCSAGFNYDVYSGWGPAFSGAMAYGTSPACALGLGCDRGADAGWWDPGTCRAYTRTTLGQPCGDVVTCPPTAYCGTLTDGGPKVCVAKPSTGGDCSRDSDCAAASRCADASDGGRCTPRKADGQPCTADSDCAHYSVCFHHVCTPGQNAVEDPVTCR
ncbi:MAG: hypothetical protein HY904_25475 [Deltaproteobacteria bacterium]|nr:hypothetical protein [Deltaproteobacteria bacterium]